MVRRVSERYALEHNLMEPGKRLRRQVGQGSAFLYLTEVSKAIGLGVVVVPKIPRAQKSLWWDKIWMPIMKYEGAFMTNSQYNNYTHQTKQVYGVAISEDTNLVFTAYHRRQVLDAAERGHDALHQALVKGGGGFVQHSTKPNCALIMIDNHVWIAAATFIFTGDCLSVNYGQACMKWHAEKIKRPLL